MKKFILLLLLIFIVPFVFGADANYLNLVFDNGYVNISKFGINGTSMSCADITGADYNVCTGVAATSDGNNYTTSIGFVGNTLNLERVGLPNLTAEATFTATNLINNCSVDGSCPAIMYYSNLTNIDTDTTISNCSVDGSCPTIMYYSNLSNIDTDTTISNCSVGGSCENIIYNNYNNNIDTNFSDGIYRFLPDSSIVVFDTDGESHLLDADLERFDEVRANTFTTRLNLSTFYNTSGYYLNVTGVDNNRISVIISNGTSALSERFPFINTQVKLSAGTTKNPVMNWVYVALNETGDINFYSSVVAPTIEHALVSKILIGNITSNPYMASLSEETSTGSLKKTQFRFKKERIFMYEGFNFNSSSLSIKIGSGKYIDGIIPKSINGKNTTQGFYLINSDGNYTWYNSFLDIPEYGDGNTIANNKYYNIIIGLTPYNGNSNIHIIVQNKPNAEYTSVVEAWADSDNTINIYPADEDLTRHFIPIARMIIKKGDNAQLLPNGYYAEDYRGGVAGGISSGGGLAESDPISVHTDGTIALTDNWNVGPYNLTADYMFANLNYSYIQNKPNMINITTVFDGEVSGTYDNINVNDDIEFNTINSTSANISTVYTETIKMGNGCWFTNSSGFIGFNFTCSI